MATKIIIYEDHTGFRNSLVNLIQQQKELRLVGAFPDCSKILEQAASLKPNVVLMDIGLPGISGIEATGMLKEKFTDINVIILSGSDDDDKVFNAIRVGADSYILKGEDNKKIIQAIKEVHFGGAPMTPSIARKMLQSFKERANKKEKAKLTEQEFEILELLKQGLSYKMIAAELDIQMDTVQVHIKNIYKNLADNPKAKTIWKIFR